MWKMLYWDIMQLLQLFTSTGLKVWSQKKYILSLLSSLCRAFPNGCLSLFFNVFVTKYINVIYQITSCVCVRQILYNIRMVSIKICDAETYISAL